MKKFHVIVCFFASLGLFSIASCKKETTITTSLLPDPPFNSAPFADAGSAHIPVILPNDFCMLYGSASDAESNIKSHAWKKISGPSAYILESPDSLATKVSKLEKGVYEFELTVTDKAGLTGRDITTVTVGENTAPKAHAGMDIQIIGNDFCMLYGSASDAESNIKSYAWKKISGPSAYILESPDSIATRVSNLEKGIYEFELTVTDKADLTGKDTTTITVGEMSANPKEIIFKDLVWGCPWECGVEIKNVYSHLPSGGVFKVYIQRDYFATWVEVAPGPSNETYYFDLYYDHLWIFYRGADVTDKPDIKLVY